MKKFNEYADSAIEFAEPYAKRTTQFFSNAKDAIEDKYYHEKKKRMRKRRIVKIKEFLDSIVGFTLILLAVIAGAMAIMKFISKSNCCKKRVKHVGGHNCGAGSASGTVKQEKVKPDKPEKKKKENSSGYITL